MVLRRQRVLLHLIKSLEGKRVSKTFLDKLLFVLRKETQVGDWVRFYHFFPYNFGPFSNNFYYDLNDLHNRGLLHEFELSPEALQLANCLTQKEKQAAEETTARFENETQAVDYVYANYPAYTVKSRLKPEPSKAANETGFATIGYEGHDIDSFLDVLIQNKVQTVADVRANPFSMNLAFTKTRLSSHLRKVGIEYIHFPELGIPSDLRKKLDLNKCFETYELQLLPQHPNEFQALAELGNYKKTALMCFEHDENKCHRNILARQLHANTGQRPQAL